jgi:hypothetical protein
VPMDVVGLDVASVEMSGDPSGTLLIVYTTFASSACEIHVVRSVDNGLTWGPLATLNPGTITSCLFSPKAATDGTGGWMVAWGSTDSLGGTIGTDTDILFSHSGDDGVSWSAPGALDPGAAADGLAADTDALVDSDRAGRWLVAWQSTNTFGGALAPGSHVLVSHSDDDGGTWTSPAALNPLAARTRSARRYWLLAEPGCGCSRPVISTRTSM